MYNYICKPDVHININIYVTWWGAHWSVTTCISVQNVTCSHKVGSNKKTIGGLSGTCIRIPPAWPHSHITFWLMIHLKHTASTWILTMLPCCWFKCLMLLITNLLSGVVYIMVRQAPHSCYCSINAIERSWHSPRSSRNPCNHYHHMRERTMVPDALVWFK